VPKGLIVDDHASLRRGLRSLLELHRGWHVSGEADSGETAVRAASEFLPDIILMDVSMPGMGGLEATKVVHAKLSLLAGANGYVLKSDSEDELIEALETVSRGGIYVTKAISPDAVSEILRQMSLQTAAEQKGQQARFFSHVTVGNWDTRTDHCPFVVTLHLESPTDMAHSFFHARHADSVFA
jgi:DNA-binding NarL/FixJ family response regulator